MTETPLQSSSSAPKSSIGSPAMVSPRPAAELTKARSTCRTTVRYPHAKSRLESRCSGRYKTPVSSACQTRMSTLHSTPEVRRSLATSSSALCNGLKPQWLPLVATSSARSGERLFPLLAWRPLWRADVLRPLWTISAVVLRPDSHEARRQSRLQSQICLSSPQTGVTFAYCIIYWM